MTGVSVRIYDCTKTHKQEVAPLAEANVLAGHGEQLIERPKIELAVPGAQSVQFLLPVELEKVPVWT